MSKLIVELPEEMHLRLKTLAAMSHRTIKEVVIDLVNEYITRLTAPSPTLKDSGFCGVWKDTRSPESIIADIKSHRNWFGKSRKKNA